MGPFRVVAPAACAAFPTRAGVAPCPEGRAASEGTLASLRCFFVGPWRQCGKDGGGLGYPLVLAVSVACRPKYPNFGLQGSCVLTTRPYDTF